MKEQIVAKEVEYRIPEVFIDYLWKLAESSDLPTSHVFSLTPNEYYEREVQDIIHFAQDSGEVNYHRIFGIQPVDEVIEILDHGEQLEMLLAR